MKKFIFFQLVFICLGTNAQQCGNCKTTPSVAIYDLDVQVSQPELKGDDTKGLLEWQQLFWLAKHANASLFNNNKNCVRFTQPPSNNNDELIVGSAFTNLPSANNDVSQYGNYLITGSVKKQGAGYVMHLELQSSCSRRIVTSIDVPFQLSAESSNTISIANQAATQLSPLIDKIKKFELEERNDNKQYAIAREIEIIKIIPAKTKLTTGQQTEFTLELKDCDGVALPGRKIVFSAEVIAGNKMPGTIGGIVSPANLITDEQGKAKGIFKMTATAGNPAIINAHTVAQTPQNCLEVLFGDIRIDALPAYKVTVSYLKTVTGDFKADSNEDGVVLKAGEKSRQDVAYSFSLLHYPTEDIKEGEQIMMMPQFEDHTEFQKSKKGNTVVLYNEGYSEYLITGTDLELIQSPFGAPPSKDEKTQRYFSSSPMQPVVSFLIKNNELVFFSGGAEFPANEEGLSPVSSSFSLNEEDENLPLQPKKVTDSGNPYKWVYEFKYQNKNGYSKEAKVFTMASKEVETATIQIWKSF